ncbi:hypothetical protein [Rhodococcus opacus]|uniref:Uncharacterized protein n=1 Tax=Rhodococcus opacus TaxID=37919 RepID=A0A2S8JAW9_RHOOP|nr:hypothetical protein [Rhodococcus opacus]PQP24150.1 hypothetical protein C5613_14820 [Rhodococcus opacus]
MALVIETTTDSEVVIDDAAKYFIDDFGRLHAIASSGRHVAAFNSQHWLSVEIEGNDVSEKLSAAVNHLTGRGKAA